MKTQPASAKSAAVFVPRPVAQLSVPRRSASGVAPSTTTVFTILVRH